MLKNDTTEVVVLIHSCLVVLVCRRVEKQVHETRRNSPMTINLDNIYSIDKVLCLFMVKSRKNL